MSPTTMAWRRLIRRPTTTLLNLVLLALGTAALATMLLVMGQLTDAAERNAAAADLVVGGNTSPAQLVLSGIFHLDAPPAPVPLARLAPVLAQPLVKRWVPVALGDSVEGHRVVGTQVPEFAGLYAAALSAGRWPVLPGDAVLGADVARATKLSAGAAFATAHGLSSDAELHADLRHRVAGVLQRTGTVVDKLVLVPIEAVWAAHAPSPHIEGLGKPPAEEPDRKASLVLVQYASPLGAVLLPRALQAAGLQTASPAREAAKLFSMVQLGADGTWMLGALLMLCAAVAVCAGLMASRREQVRDVAVLRLLGASRGFTAAVVGWEAVLIALLGTAAGLVIAHGAVEWIGQRLPASAPGLTGWAVHPGEAALALSACAVALLGAAWPAWQAQRAAVADVLAMR